ncbi:hypothetical protein PRZ48_008900 [Zasmidium cellare]|uniref:Uncharacterized protein n=1 Tax=Zasmidium cellare TaxID=395010 RepID=A0ABR0EHK0_ZASCE|nr:hypothetical protein PRZ48_008900 [Zasmidium cellare]
MNIGLMHTVLPPFSLPGYRKMMLGFERVVEKRESSQLDLTHPTADDKRRAAAIALDNALLKFMARNEIIAAHNLISILQEAFTDYSGFANNTKFIEQSRLGKSEELQSVNTDACMKFLTAYEYCALAQDEIRTKVVMELGRTIFVQEFWDDVKADYYEQHAVGVYN